MEIPTSPLHLSALICKGFAVHGVNSEYLAQNGLPWQIAILIDSTIQHRASVHPENAKTFNHGKGFVIGHQWTNIVLLLNDSLIPLPPIPFYSKRYCQEHNRQYHTEHELVIDYIEQLCLEDYIGAHIGKYLSSLRKLDDVITPKEGFET